MSGKNNDLGVRFAAAKSLSLSPSDRLGVSLWGMHLDVGRLRSLSGAK
jgi:hypothetical protein